ncbi:hypothetical protein J7E70_07940 [Variovorax paradoxus]|nr:hypothetical protein [Variovorax paradoxus]MBT2300394.1 hypothetical protein [Variovorax paradoxus]
MSLESLTKLRRTGGKPAALWVVVGDCPESIRALPDTIAVTEKPQAMDWRPVVGLHVDIFDLSGDDWLLCQTMDAIEAAQPKAIGVACNAGVLGLSEQHERVMTRIWRHLANHS